MRQLRGSDRLADLGATTLTKRRPRPSLTESSDGDAAGRFDKAAKACMGAPVTALAGRGGRPDAVASGALVLAGAVPERWSVFMAGFQPARGPKYTVTTQRERLFERLRERDGMGTGG